MKLRHKAKVKHQGKIILRNIYSHYISNNNPVYCRINNQIHLVHLEYDSTLKESVFIPTWTLKDNPIKT